MTNDEKIDWMRKRGIIIATFAPGSGDLLSASLGPEPPKPAAAGDKQPKTEKTESEEHVDEDMLFASS